MKHNANLQAILDKGKAFLDKGDVAGYWGVMSRHSGFARLAGDVASGKGLIDHLVTRDLQRAALKSRGTKFSREELAQIGLQIADADLRTRHKNLKENGHIGVTGQDTVDYHNDVFKKWRLPKNTFTPALLEEALPRCRPYRCAGLRDRLQLPCGDPRARTHRQPLQLDKPNGGYVETRCEFTGHS